jgi:hypothetical protein
MYETSNSNPATISRMYSVGVRVNRRMGFSDPFRDSPYVLGEAAGLRCAEQASRKPVARW